MVRRKKDGRNENEIGNFIGRLRRSKGYSREEVGSGMCSQATLSRIEKGDRNAFPQAGILKYRRKKYRR